MSWATPGTHARGTASSLAGLLMAVLAQKISPAEAQED
jgi:hypothetical protein